MLEGFNLLKSVLGIRPKVGYWCTILHKFVKSITELLLAVLVTDVLSTLGPRPFTAAALTQWKLLLSDLQNIAFFQRKCMIYFFVISKSTFLAFKIVFNDMSTISCSASPSVSLNCKSHRDFYQF